MRPRYAAMDLGGFAGLDVGERREYMGSSTQVLELQAQGFKLQVWPYLQKVHVVSYLGMAALMTERNTCGPKTEGSCA